MVVPPDHQGNPDDAADQIQNVALHPAMLQLAGRARQPENPIGNGLNNVLENGFGGMLLYCGLGRKWTVWWNLVPDGAKQPEEP